MKERYLSKTPNVTFVYISKCNIKLSGIFGNFKKKFLWTGLVITQDLCYLSGRRALKVLIVLKIGMLPAPEVKNDNRNKMKINV